MNLRTLVAAAAVAALLAPASARAGGFGISEYGARSSGRASAAAALYDDPSAIFFNPAAITRLPGVQLELGVSSLMPRWEFAEAGKTSDWTRSETAVVPPPNVSLTYNLGDPGIGPLAAGLGFYVPYGSTFSWPSDWVGRETIQEIALQVFELAPVIAWRPLDALAVGVGLRVMPANVYMKRGVGFGTEQEGVVELAGKGTALGASAGIAFWPTDKLSLALSWRSGVTLDLEGDADFQFAPPFDTQAKDGPVKTRVPLAQVFRLGAAYDLTPALNISADLEYQMWSTFKELRIDFVETGLTSVSARNSQDSFVVHVGAEYRMSPSFAVRAGYLYDQHTLPEETVNPAPPDSDKHLLSLGASWYFGQRYGLHAYFANVFFAERAANLAKELPGSYRGGWGGGTMAYLFGLTGTASFDVAPGLGERSN